MIPFRVFVVSLVDIPHLPFLCIYPITFVFLFIFQRLTGVFSVGPFILSNTGSLKDLLSLRVHAGTQVLPAI